MPSINFDLKADGSGKVVVSASREIAEAILRAIAGARVTIEKYENSSDFAIHFKKDELNPAVISSLMSATKSFGLSVRNMGDKAKFAAAMKFAVEQEMPQKKVSFGDQTSWHRKNLPGKAEIEKATTRQVKQSGKRKT